MKRRIKKGIIIGLIMFIFWNAVGGGLASFCQLDDSGFAKIKDQYKKAEFGWKPEYEY